MKNEKEGTHYIFYENGGQRQDREGEQKGEIRAVRERAHQPQASAEIQCAS